MKVLLLEKKKQRGTGQSYLVHIEIASKISSYMNLWTMFLKKQGWGGKIIRKYICKLQDYEIKTGSNHSESILQQNEAGNMMKIETKLQKMKGNKLLMDWTVTPLFQIEAVRATLQVTEFLYHFRPSIEINYCFYIFKRDSEVFEGV